MWMLLTMIVAAEASPWVAFPNDATLSEGVEWCVPVQVASGARVYLTSAPRGARFQLGSPESGTLCFRERL